MVSRSLFNKKNDVSIGTSRSPHYSPVPMDVDDESDLRPQNSQGIVASQSDSLERMEVVESSQPHMHNNSKQQFGLAATQQNGFDARNDVGPPSDQNILIREAQMSAHRINARLQDLTPENKKLYLETLEGNLWRTAEQDDTPKEALSPEESKNGEDEDDFIVLEHDLSGKIIDETTYPTGPSELVREIDSDTKETTIGNHDLNSFDLHEKPVNKSRLFGSSAVHQQINIDKQQIETEDIVSASKMNPSFNPRDRSSSYDSQKSQTNSCQPENRHESVSLSSSVQAPKLIYESKPAPSPPSTSNSAQKHAAPQLFENPTNSHDMSDSLNQISVQSTSPQFDDLNPTKKNEALSKNKKSYQKRSIDPYSIPSSQMQRESFVKDSNEQTDGVLKGRLNSEECYSTRSYSDVVKGKERTTTTFPVEKRVNETKAKDYIEVPKVNTFKSEAQKVLDETSPPIARYDEPKVSVPPKAISLETVESRVAEVKQQKIEWLQKRDNSEIRNCGSTTKKSINILVLGQTGVGKSTWINAFVNYLTYPNLDEAIAAEAPICMIPTKFTMFDEKYQRHDVLLGAHDNEVFSDRGQSATQNTKTYLVQRDEYDIYIIDTPGMDDTRGVEKDDENIQKILRSIAPFKEIHSICFLFKANDARLTNSFRYSIGKLLGNLSKTALNNACFVFTNARGTFYRPGDTMGPMKTYFRELKEKEGLSVRIDDSNIFCLDNEAFRFVCAHFSAIQFTAPEMKTFADSWRHSSNEVHRLLLHASRVRPHNTSDTLSINETRTWIYQLIDPILKASMMIQTNLQQLDDQKGELMKAENNVDELRKLASIRVTSMEIIHLHMPQTVCESQKCTAYQMIEGRKETIYKTVCHKDCNLGFNSDLASCTAFCRGSGICIECSCHVDEHTRIKYKQTIVTKSLENPKKLAVEVSAAEMKRKSIRRLERLIDGYHDELNYILFAMATFSAFLTENGITQKVDLFAQHLQKLIKAEEKKLRSVAGVDRNEYDQLMALLNIYRDNCIEFDYQRTSHKISLDELQDIRQKLFSMPLTGSNIAEIFDIHVKVDHQDYASGVTHCGKSMFQKVYSGVKDGVKKVFSLLGVSSK